MPNPPPRSSAPEPDVGRHEAAQRLAEEQLRASEENLRNVAALARGLPSHENPRRAICDATALIAGADIVQLWEPDGTAHLKATATTGAELSDELRVPIVGEISGTAKAFTTQARDLVLDLDAPGAEVSVRMRERLGVASALYEPVMGRNGPVGVLVVLWKMAVTHAAGRNIDAVGLIATEAAAAIERADLIAQLHEQSRKDELRVRQLLDGAPDGVIISDAAGTIQTVNEQTLRLFGYAREELTGVAIDQLVPDAHGGHARHGSAPITDPSDRMIGVERELTARRKDGTEVPVSITFSPVQTDRGLVVMAAVRDITERRAEQARLQAAEEHFRRSFDDAPIGMTIAGLDGRYIKVNDAFCTIVGRPREALIGLTRQAITHPDDNTGDQEVIRAMLTGDATTFVREKRFLHGDGHPVWTSLSVTVVRDGLGEPTHFITQAQDITDRRLYESQLKHMADHDPLTGLLNRRGFDRELAGHIAGLERSGPVGAVLMVDLDNFKYYNDTQGHGAGDDLIVRIGQALRGSLRETDVLARLGGDEFAVLLVQADRAGAAVVAGELLEVVRNEAPAPIHGGKRRVTASIGIACFADGARLSREEIMVNADRAMYEAKGNGRNGVARYGSHEHERTRIESHTKWAGEITQALAADRFELLAQPIQPLQAVAPTQYELLLRMHDARGEDMTPESFLYIAERLGMIQEIDAWVVTRAIDMLAEQRSAGHDLRFEVNVSGHSIGDAAFLTLIEGRLQDTAVPADRLIFEITETAAVANIARATTFANRLARLGCGFALDDFGAGYGSFYHLKHLPFDYLKIDGEFISHCTSSATDRILISAIVHIARAMGKQTIAECVEDQETTELLTGLGVDFGQGYFLGRPEPLVQHLLATQASGHGGADPSGDVPSLNARSRPVLMAPTWPVEDR